MPQARLTLTIPRGGEYLYVLTAGSMSLVEDIVDAHDGEITVTESENGGARFEITGVECIDCRRLVRVTSVSAGRGARSSRDTVPTVGSSARPNNLDQSSKPQNTLHRSPMSTRRSSKRRFPGKRWPDTLPPPAAGGITPGYCPSWAAPGRAVR